jgi:signal transduction histidine kinase
VHLTPRELATRAFALTVLAVGWTATVLAWPDREMTGSEAVALGGGLLAVGWLDRRVVRTSTSGHSLTFEDLVLVPLVLVYPAGWVMAAGVVAALFRFWPTRWFRTRWYRAAFTSGLHALEVLASSLAASSIARDDAARVVLAGLAAALAYVVVADVLTTAAVTVERGGPLAECYSVDDVVTKLREVPVVAAFAVLVYQARAGDWPVLAAVGLVLLVQQLLSRAARADLMAMERAAEREQLLRLVVGAGDRQRREVTSQIHDGPLQVVVATRVLLDSMTSRLEAGAPADHDQLKVLSRHLTGAIDDLRSTLHEGYRDRLVVSGVRDGLTEVLREHEGTFPRGYRLAVDDRLDLSVDTSVALLLILREAIVNAAKHSRARSVAVSVCADGATAVGEVVDDGVGIDSSELLMLHREGHLGIALMRERAERAGGTTTIERRDTGGSTVRVTLPMSPLSDRPVEDWERAPESGSHP